jgi:predicted RNA binding protein YcfA (HicA-like mRNA interferase family)
MSEHLPVMSGIQAMKAFQKAGWAFVRVARSNHLMMEKKGFLNKLSIPDHKTLDKGITRFENKAEFSY